MKAVRVLISGSVQGVGFRWSVQRAANGLHVAGWVRNLSDGRVEARFEGDEAAVDSAVEYCHRGPDTARVKAVEVSGVEPEGCDSFRVR